MRQKPKAKGGKGNLSFPTAQPKKSNKATHITRREEILEQKRKHLAQSKKMRTDDGQAINWSGLQDIKGGGGVFQTHMNVKRKYKKRFSSEGELEGDITGITLAEWNMKRKQQ